MWSGSGSVSVQHYISDLTPLTSTQFMSDRLPGNIQHINKDLIKSPDLTDGTVMKISSE